MSEEPNAETPRDGSWPRASAQPSVPEPVAPSEPAAPVNPLYPPQGQQGYPPQQYPPQSYPQQYPPQGQQGYPQQYLPQGQQPYSPQASHHAAAGTVQLNFWLSVFFSWIPALIFYVTEKGKNQLADEYHRQNLNFSLVRVICAGGMFIPYLGFLFFLAGLVLFVFHIMAASSAQADFNRGQLPRFVFNLNLVR
ncbi:DUF4870 domain-containing protein [Paeniglutamicibacter cryotolerans]|uniref:Putative membrane protein n=1 Tax=Paeniglutamicibacter cryotolerans TaxID=670079 RepID=A0A839QSZ1_9MICC|nr:DUF4870 domain-containing protein [Paeniglutamicibacter cryotolerans]MBB2995161.1 putative membrane protein [Paeniglutamicibacter cryotolerans]